MGFNEVMKKYGGRTETAPAQQTQVQQTQQAQQPQPNTGTGVNAVLQKYGATPQQPKYTTPAAPQQQASQPIIGPKPANPYSGASVAFKAAADYLKGDAVDATKRQQLLQQATDAMDKLPAYDLMARQSMKDVIDGLNERAAYDGQAIFAQRKEQNDQATGTYKNALWQMLGLASKASTSGLTEDEVRQQMALASQMKQAREQVKEANKVIEWDGRKELLDEYEHGGHNPNTEEGRARLQEIREQIRQGDLIAGNGDRSVNFGERVGDTTSGALKNIGAGMIKAAGTTGQLVGESQAIAQARSTDQFLLDQMLGVDHAAHVQAVEEAVRSEEAQRQWDKIHGAARNLSESAAVDLERAKNGLGVFGQAAVDIGENVIEMGFDAGVAALTGGSSLVPMFIRSAGSGMLEAEREGATLEQQMLYGLSSAAVEVATEKMFDGVAHIYGAGAADELTEALIRRLTSSPTGQTFLRVLVDATGEGVEELISGAVGPALQAIYKDGNALQQYKDFDWSEVVYSAIIGYTIGMLGGGTSIASGQSRAANAENAQWNSVYEGLGEQPTLGRELRDRSLMNRVQENPDAYNPENRTTLGQQATDAMQALARGQSEADRAAAIQQQRKSSTDRAMELLGLKPAETRVNGQPILTPKNQHERIVYDLLTQGEFTEEKAELILQNQALEMAVEDIGQIKLDGLSHEEKIQALLETYGNAAESTEAADHESVPDHSQDSPEAPSDAFNTQEEETVSGEEAKADSKELISKLRAGSKDMQFDRPVADVKGDEFKKGPVDLVTQVSNFFQSLGNKVFRKGFGDVTLDKRGVRSDIAHGIGRAKAATFAAVPDVIANGKVIDHQTNWKGRGYDSYVIAAPVTLNGNRTYVAAVILQNKADNSFYLHEVIDNDGNLIYVKDAPSVFKPEGAPTEAPADVKTGVTAQDGVAGEAEASTDIVQQDTESVNAEPEPAKGKPRPIGPKRAADIARDAYAQEMQREAEAHENDGVDVDAEDFDEDAYLANQEQAKDGRWMNDVPDEAEQHQPGENKSNRESLLASEPAETEQAEESPETDTEYETRKAQQEADENREANDYEERRKAGKLTEEEKAAAKAKAKERQGEKRNAAVDKIAKKLADWGEKWTKIAGETTVEEDGTETTTSNEANLAAAVQGYADGTVSAQELLEAYEALNSDGELSYDSLFYFDKVVGNLTRLANLESELNYQEANGLAKGEDYEKLKNDFAQSSEQALKCLDTMIARGEKNFADRKAFRDEVTMNFRVERSGIRGTFDKAKAWYYRIQQNPRLFFEWLGGFDKKNSKTSYEFAQRVDKAQLKQISVRQSALTYFADVVKMKGYSDLETGKTKGTVDIPGLGKLSLNYELSLLKTLETAGAIEHIVKNGADFAVESDYYANRNNGGFGQTKSFPNQLDIRAMGDAILEKKGIKKPKAEDIEAARTEALNNLKDELRKDVMGNDVAKAAYEASVKAMRYLARELNITSAAMYGYGFALGGNTYWPIESVGKRQNSEAKKATVYDIEDSSFTHRRSGPSGKLRIRPFVEVMSSYSNRASIYAAWAEFRSDLHMMDTAVGNNTETFAAILNGYGEADSKHSTSHTASEYFSRWLKTIDGDMDANSKFAAKLRSNLAQSSLTLNAGVALKQTPSYWDAAGEIDYDILLKNWRPVKSARSYDTNSLLAEVNKRTGLLESRKIGYNAVEMGDAADAAHSLGGKVVGKLPSWMTNWINKMDYRTVSNLALAAAAQVERNNPNLTKGSNAYYNAVVETFERAVLHSQPIYNAQYRAENLRSSNEIVRSLSMFRTQQTQNFNQQAEAWGEYLAARENGDKEATKEAKRHLVQVIGGQVTGSVLFSLLAGMAQLLNHRTKDYEDEEGHLSGKKVAGRLALNMVESVAATAWFGDTLAAIAIDGLSNAASGGKGTSEFYSLSESTTQLVSDAATGLISATKTLFNPDKTAAQKGKAANDFAKSLASACGIPLGNAYNLVNSAMMFYTDAQHKNVGNYDDVYKRVAEYSALSESARAGRTAEQAIVYFGRGDKNRADAALSTLDYSSKKVSSTVQSSMKQAYEDGKIDEKTLRSILMDYCGLDSEDLEKVMNTAAIDIAYSEEKEADKKTFDAVEALLANVVDKKRDDDRPTDYYKMDAIIGTMLNEKQIDTVVDKQMNQDYRANYNALRGAGMSPKKTAELLETLDTDQNGGVNQNEMYNYFLTHTGEEKYISKLWNAQGYDGDNTRTWSAFKASRKNMEYDTLKAQNEGNATFTALEQQMKDLKSDSSFMLQNAGSDKAIFDKIIGGGFSDSETDAAVKQYVSSDGRAYYGALRDKGLSPSDAVDLINEIDGYATKNGKPNNGSIAIDELMEFYKAHPDQEDLAIALYYTTDRKYTWEEQKKKKKVK